jgi:hypothetical protein
MRTLRTAIALLVVSVAGPAAAQEPDAPADGPFPNLATLDRGTDHSDFNGSLALSFFGDNGPDSAARLDLGGQYVTPQGFGGYAQVPLTYLDGGDESETELGNIELGGVYIAKAGEGLDVVMKGGLVLPTGPDDLNFLVTYAGAAIPRLTDLISAAPDVTALRLNGSPLYRQGTFFARADLGIDIVIDEPDGSDSDPLIHINLAAGMQAGSVTIAGEIVTLGTTGDVDEDEGRFYHTAAISVGMDAGSVRPYGALVFPFDNDLASEFLDGTLAIMAGIEVPIASR